MEPWSGWRGPWRLHGLASARDPKYTVVPQRQRMAARQNEHAATVTP